MTKHTFFCANNRSKYHSKGPSMIMPGRALCGTRMESGNVRQIERTIQQAYAADEVCKTCVGILEVLVARSEA